MTAPVEILRDGDIRWREMVMEPGIYERRNESDGAQVAHAVVSCPVVVHVKERWVRTTQHWVPVWHDWENARPAPTAWQRFKAWLTYPGQRCLPEATARNRWVGAIGRVGQ